MRACCSAKNLPLSSKKADSSETAQNLYFAIGMTKKIHPDQRYVEALLKNDDAVIREIYKRFSPKVISYVERNNGTRDEARDVIQDSLITIYQQRLEKGLQLTCPFDAYFFLLCKRKW